MIEILVWILMNAFYMYLAGEYIVLLWRPRRERKILVILFALILWGTVNVGGYYLNYTEGISETIALVMIVFIFVTGVLILTGLKKIMEDRKRLDLHLRQQQMDLISKQYEIIAANQEETRRQRHELKNNYLAIETMAKKGNISEIISFVQGLSQKLHVSSCFAATGNVAVDSVINYKIEHTQVEQIQFKLNLNIPVELDVKDAVLCGVLGNALDNAIDASSKIPSSERMISVVMTVERKNLFIEITNNYDGILLTDKLGRIVTRKENGSFHGFGLSEMQQLLERNNGTMETVWSDRQFQIRIIFYHVL